MNIRFGVVRDIVVDDMADPFDIKSAGSYIGGNDNVQRARLQFLDGFFACRLSHVAIERSTGKATRLELFGKLCCCRFGADEDDHAFDIFCFENSGQGIQFVQTLNLPEALHNRLDSRGLCLDLDLDRVAQMPARNPHNLFRHGCREKRCLPLIRSFFENRFDIIDKTHA